MRPAALFLPALALLVVACASPSPSVAPVTNPTPVASPSNPATPAPSPTPAAPAPSTPAPSVAPTASPVPSMTADEAALIKALRLDAGTDCAPRRTGLPVGALYGIECRPDDRLVARVGIYRFASANEAAYAYMTRMADSGVDVNAGDCTKDIPGDVAWAPGDGEGNFDDPGVFNWENGVLFPGRTGCFLDENGTANVRATCDTVYVGVLGTGTDLSDLQDWTWRYPTGYEPGTPDRPGICVGPA